MLAKDYIKLFKNPNKKFKKIVRDEPNAVILLDSFEGGIVRYSKSDGLLLKNNLKVEDISEFVGDYGTGVTYTYYVRSSDMPGCQPKRILKGIIVANIP